MTQKIGKMRANASAKSHAELDEAEDLDDGDPQELATQYSHRCGRAKARGQQPYSRNGSGGRS